MKVRIKRLHPHAVIPSYAKAGDAGMDLTAVEDAVWDVDNAAWSCRTGIAVEIPEGYVGLVFPRSSIYKTDLSLTNAVGVIDSGYRGEITAKFRDHGHEFNQKRLYGAGDRIAQLVIIPYPAIEFEEVEELSSTDRGAGGFGSTGK